MIFFVFISLHINLGHICMGKSTSGNLQPQASQRASPCLSYGRSLSIPFSPCPFRSDWSGCSEQLPYFTHSGPTPRSQDPPFQFQNSLIARVTGASRGCPIVFSLFLEKPLNVPPSTAFTQFRCHTKLNYQPLTCFPFPFLIQKTVTPIRLANKSIRLFLAL